MTRIKLTESEKLERKLMKMFERQFVNYHLDFTLAKDTTHLYDIKNKYIGQREYYINKETYLMFLAYRAGYLKGKSKL